MKWHWDICSHSVSYARIHAHKLWHSVALFARQKPLVMAPRFSRITISRRCRHDTRYVHAFRRVKAIFRSNMIIKSNGIRNSSAVRILSTNPLVPRRFLLPLSPSCLLALSFVAIHSRFPLDKARNAFRSFSFLLFFSPLLFFLCPSALTLAFTSRQNRQTKRKHHGKRRNV